MIRYLKGGVNAWSADGKETDNVASIPVTELNTVLNKNSDTYLVDVRRESEYLSEHIKGAENAPLSTLNEHLANLPDQDTFYVHCAGGYRSMIANSILKSKGIHNFIDVAAGFKAIKETKISVTDYVCPSTL